MAKIIISMDGGIIADVHTDALEPMSYILHDEEDEHDPEFAQLHAACRYLVDRDAMQGCDDFQHPNLDNDKTPIDTKTFALPHLDGRGFLLVCDQNQAQSENGLLDQKLETAFVCGYLEASAELSRFISGLYRGKDPMARAVYDILRPLMDRQSDNYFKLCAELNDVGRYDRP